ncbi:putative transcription regulator [Gluconacetobacter diazotrophicus PA1 5]|uniref:Putative transcription regulator n=1 Tax=Gluconacetobacter diazotrophicus (strain ATCC 49037 / DSM 5601 / CCUG 37298 / CIP 103539 / LMG 7603 / PAl5) TaxID=272568 RepID=A9H659_GLUDA|nr:putative transcription regulator [Gluconacetobacter diazotrophicus PA1 5]
MIEATLAMMEAGEMPRVEEVARRAGVQKSSIYRRWETIGGLVFEAVGMKARLTMPLPDTGSCQDDLRTYLASMVAFHRSDFGRLVTRLIVDVPEAVRREFWRARLDAASILLKRGQARGEVAQGLDVRLATEMLIAPLYFRALVSAEEVVPELADTISGLVLSGAAS